ncbi:hypothetical protein ACROYT_G022537 [Oculina patagonica]
MYKLGEIYLEYVKEICQRNEGVHCEFCAQTGEISPDEGGSIQAFSEKYAVDQDLVVKYLHHLAYLHMMKEKREREKREKAERKKNLAYEDVESQRAQVEVNAHSVLWVRILNAGEGVGGQARIKSNMMVHNSSLAPLYALRKDHKNVADHNVGPPVRPVCGAVTTYNRKLSHLISFILAEVWKEAESVCLNTEEMLAGFKQLNDSHVTEDIVVGSADVKALYPSLDIAFTVEKVCKVFHKSSVQVVGVNDEELGLYLALNKTEADLRDMGLLQFCPRRKTNRGGPPTITGCALDENKTKRYKPWLPPAEEPDEVTIRKMFTEAMKVVLLFIMENHMYTFNEVKLQSRGGPIGLELTGVLAQLFMVWWDRQFVKKVEDNGLRLRVYKRYVHNINVIMNIPSSGLRFVDGKVIQDSRLLN